MHEMSICRAIADTVIRHADGREVELVRLRIGHFRQIVPDTLEFCWGVLKDELRLSGSRLEIEEVPAIVRCNVCEKETQLDLPIPLCASCTSSDVELLSGEEFTIESIEVSEEES